MMRPKPNQMFSTGPPYRFNWSLKTSKHSEVVVTVNPTQTKEASTMRTPNIRTMQGVAIARNDQVADTLAPAVSKVPIMKFCRWWPWLHHGRNQ